jgi:hypothetical protein
MKEAQKIAVKNLTDFPPGSAIALHYLCRCPVIDNSHGYGYLCSDGSRFVVNSDCPLHGVLASSPSPVTEEK